MSHFIKRFNENGLPAIAMKYGGGAKVKYTAKERERVLTEVRRQPDAEKDGTKTGY